MTDSGTERWEFPTERGVGGVSVADGTAYVSDGSLSAVDPADGTERWQFWLGEAIHSTPPVAVGGTVYVGAGDHLYAVDAADGTERWRYRVDEDRIHGRPVPGGDVVVVGTDEALYGVETDTGIGRWRYEVPGDPRAMTVSSSVADGAVYAATGQILCAVEVADGTERWTHDPEEMVASPTAAGDAVYVLAGTDLAALAAADGTERWRVDTGARVHPDRSPVATGEVVWVGGERLLVVDAATGTERRSVAFDGPVRATAVDDGTAFCADDETLYAVDATAGTELWRFEHDWSIDKTAPAVADDVVCVGFEFNAGAVRALERAD